LVEPGALEGFLPEKLDGADGLGGGGTGELLFVLEVDAILADLLRIKQVGGFTEVFAQLAQATPVGLFGAGLDGQEC
jgi:hypothetical protein